VCDGVDLSPDAFPFMSAREGTVAGVPARVMRISFSGELAYEINVCANEARHVWNALIDAGARYGITPYGTETMHVLRAEKGYVIVGQDTDGSCYADRSRHGLDHLDGKGLPRLAIAAAPRYRAP
jgi:sarcosine oxidase subunit alpha